MFILLVHIKPKPMYNLKFLAALLLLSPLFLVAQDGEDENDYNMVELVYLMPNNDAVQAFEEAVLAHNEEFHADGPYGSGLYQIITGKHSGWYVWTMGPCTFTHLDDRPDSEAHNDDWRENVVTHIHKWGRSEYWRRNDEVSNVDEESEKMIELWWLDIAEGEWYRFNDFMKKVAPVSKERGDDMALYWNAFDQNDGREAVLVFGFDKWAELDEDNPMKPSYEAIHGEDSWQDGMKEWEDFMDGVVQEVWRLVE